MSTEWSILDRHAAATILRGSDVVPQPFDWLWQAGSQLASSISSQARRGQERLVSRSR